MRGRSGETLKHFHDRNPRFTASHLQLLVPIDFKIDEGVAPCNRNKLLNLTNLSFEHCPTSTLEPIAMVFVSLREHVVSYALKTRLIYEARLITCGTQLYLKSDLDKKHHLYKLVNLKHEEDLYFSNRGSF